MIKKFLLKIYYGPDNSPEKANYFQKIARDCEWETIKMYVKKGTFLDVGCGAGYAMELARQIGCVPKGIDPEPMLHGVGRRNTDSVFAAKEIVKAVAEDIPFPDNFFETVYSSHVLEHVNNIEQSLHEMKRVSADEGVIIIGVPTATMAYINWFTQFIFTTHQKIVNVLFSKFISTGKTKWWEIFIPSSHSFENKTILFDLRNYRARKWTEILKKELKITHIIKPCLYSYPEYRQLFRLRRNSSLSSSVFFICSKKEL